MFSRGEHLGAGVQGNQQEVGRTLGRERCHSERIAHLGHGSVTGADEPCREVTAPGIVCVNERDANAGRINPHRGHTSGYRHAELGLDDRHPPLTRGPKRSSAPLKLTEGHADYRAAPARRRGYPMFGVRMASQRSILMSDANHVTAERCPGALRQQLADELGTTLIEVLVTALMVILVASGVAVALVANAHASGDQRLRSQADALATQDQERLRGLSDQQLANLNVSSTQTRAVSVDVNGQKVPFTVASTATYADRQGGSSCASSAAALYRVTSTVTWSENFNGQTPSVSEDSLVSRPVTGQLLTTAQDQTATPLAGVSVAASPQTIGQGELGQQGVTDDSGCALLAGLQAGPYTISVSRTGYVDENGAAMQKTTATLADTDVTAVSTPGNPFTLGLAGAVDATFATETDAGVSAPAEADGVSWLNTADPSGAQMKLAGVYPATAPATPLVQIATPNTLFPFDEAPPNATPDYSDNYSVWGGRCTGQEPVGGKPVFSVQPGMTASDPTVQEPFLLVTGFSATVNGTPQTVPTDISLSYTGTNSDGSVCRDAWNAAVAPAAAGGAAPSTGWLRYPGQPYAGPNSLTVCADYRSAAGSYLHGTVVTANASLTSENPVATITATQKGACAA